MLHEEVDLKWEEIMSWIQDFQLLEKLRPELVVGVSLNLIRVFKKLINDLHMLIFTFIRFIGDHNLYRISSKE